MTDFLVRKDDWRTHRFVDAPTPELTEGQVLFRVDRFAFTANNVSYALAGDLLGYWRFFPAPDGWGRLPVMGFADVVRSRRPDVAEGTRCFGFYPMSQHLVIQPGQVSAAQIVDAAPHRGGLAHAYNQYVPTTGDPLHRPEDEDALMLLRGLFLTSFLADDFLADHEHFGARTVIVSSASSKTAIALGHCMTHGKRVQAVGLTSARNRDFVRGLGCWDNVLTYDELAALDPATPAVYVDLAGSGSLLRSVHEHFGDRLRHSCAIGATHWEADRPQGRLPGPKPQFFFAPSQIQKRLADWGSEGYQERLGAAWSAFLEFARGWLSVERGHGPDAVAAVYRETLEGKTRPEQGHILSLWDAIDR